MCLGRRSGACRNQATRRAIGLPTLGTRAVPPQRAATVRCLVCGRAGRLTAASVRVAASCPGTLPTSSSCGPASVQQSPSSLWGGTELQDSRWALGGERPASALLAGRKRHWPEGNSDPRSEMTTAAFSWDTIQCW